MNRTDAVKLFFLSNQLLEHQLGRIEAEFDLELRRTIDRVTDQDADYYPQFERRMRSEAAAMAPHYEVFFALENSIRELVSESLQGSDGDSWWETARVPPPIKKSAEERRQREVDTGMTPRSTELIDYTTFGELSEIIRGNWDIFGAIFSSPKAVMKVMASLNSLRGPIAHCKGLADDEVVRLRLTVGDWFRLME